MKRIRSKKFPDRDTKGRKMPGCKSINPLAGIRKEKPPQPEAPATIQDASSIDAQLITAVSVRKYINSLRQAVERGDPQASDRYERALSHQEKVIERKRGNLELLSEDELCVLASLIGKSELRGVEKDFVESLLAVAVQQLAPGIGDRDVTPMLKGLLPMVKQAIDDFQMTPKSSKNSSEPKVWPAAEMQQQLPPAGKPKKVVAISVHNDNDPDLLANQPEPHASTGSECNPVGSTGRRGGFIRDWSCH